MMPPGAMPPGVGPGPTPTSQPMPGRGGVSSAGPDMSPPGLPGSKLPDVPGVQTARYQGSSTAAAGDKPSPADAPPAAPKPW